MIKSATTFLALFGLVFVQLAPAQQGAAGVKTLRGADAAVSDRAPPERPYAGKFPGSQKPVARTFSTQPPVIPHAIDGIDTVTREANPCLSCHGPENYAKVKAPKIADSHFRDRDGKTLPQVSSRQYECTLCHVPQANAKPLVENTFSGDTAAMARGKK